MPWISEAELSALHLVAHDAADVSAGIDRDETGIVVAGQFVGGNGGLVSRPTLQANERLRRSLNDLNALPDSGTEG